jgi:hypothetical protein
MSHTTSSGFIASISAGSAQTKLIQWVADQPAITGDPPSPGKMEQIQAQLSNLSGSPAELRVQLFADESGSAGTPLTEVVALPIIYADDPTKAGALASVELIYIGPVWARVSFDDPLGSGDLTFITWAEEA